MTTPPVAAGVATRPLTAADVPFATELLNAEGWAFTPHEINRLLDLGGGFVVTLDGAPAGLLTLVTHDRVAWVGNVAVAASARGRGLGAHLVAAALDAAPTRGVTSVGLYSVPRAVSLYERHGFVQTGRALSLTAWGRGGTVPDAVEPLAGADVAAAAAFDAHRFGDDRGRLLRTLTTEFPDSSFMVKDASGLRGFAVVKLSETGAEIGPLTTRAGDDEALGWLYDAALAAVPDGDGVEVGVDTRHVTALRLLADRGFRESFPAATMVHGPVHAPVDPFAIGAVAGMEKG